jgi:hypothetical protein
MELSHKFYPNSFSCLVGLPSIQSLKGLFCLLEVFSSAAFQQFLMTIY